MSGQPYTSEKYERQNVKSHCFLSGKKNGPTDSKENSFYYKTEEKKPPKFMNLTE